MCKAVQHGDVAINVDDAGGILGFRVEVGYDSAVEYPTPGEYTVTYTVSDGAGNAVTPKTRTVTVQDTTAPVITLNGGNVTQQVGEPYTDQGATASDDCEGAYDPPGPKSPMLSTTVPARSCSPQKPPPDSTPSKLSAPWPKSLPVLTTPWSMHPSTHAYCASANRVSERDKALLAMPSDRPSVELPKQWMLVASSHSPKWAMPPDIIARYRPQVLICAITLSEEARRRCSFIWGVHAIMSIRSVQTDELAKIVDEALLSVDYVKEGDILVIAGGTPLAIRTRTNMLKLHIIGEEA